VGKGKAELDGVILALTQIASKGKISAEEINQIAERVPQIRQILQDAFGTADTEALQKRGLSSEEFLTRVTTALEKIPQVTSGAQNSIENFGDALNQVLATIGNTILPPLTQALDAIVPYLNSFKTWFEGLPPLAKGAALAVGTFAAAFPPLLLSIAGLLSAGGMIASTFAPLFAAGGLLAVEGAAVGGMGAFAAVLTGPVGLAIVATVAAVAGLTYAFTQAQTAGMGVHEMAVKQAKAQQDAANANRVAYTEVEKLTARYEELQRKTSPSKDEQEEMRRVMVRIGELAPELVAKYDELSRAVELVGNAHARAAESMRTWTKEERDWSVYGKVEAIKALEEKEAALKTHLVNVRRMIEQGKRETQKIMVDASGNPQIATTYEEMSIEERRAMAAEMAAKRTELLKIQDDIKLLKAERKDIVKSGLPTAPVDLSSAYNQIFESLGITAKNANSEYLTDLLKTREEQARIEKKSAAAAAAAAKAAAAQRIRDTKEMTDRILELSNTEFEYSRRTLERKALEYKKHGISVVQVVKWLNAEVKALEEQRDLKQGSMMRPFMDANTYMMPDAQALFARMRQYDDALRMAKKQGLDRTQLFRLREKERVEMTEDMARRQKSAIEEVGKGMALLSTLQGDATAAGGNALRNALGWKTLSAAMKETWENLRGGVQADAAKRAIGEMAEQAQKLLDMERQSHLDPNMSRRESFVERFAEEWKKLPTLAEQEKAKTMLRGFGDELISIDEEFAKHKGFETYVANLQKSIAEASTYGGIEEFATSLMEVKQIGSSLSLVQPYSDAQIKQLYEMTQVLRRTKEVQNAFVSLREGARDIFVGMFEDLSKRFDTFFNTLIGGFRKLLVRMAAEYLASQLSRIFTSFLSRVFGAASSVPTGVSPTPVTLPENPISGFMADGGRVFAGRDYMVGENGVERFTPTSDGVITPAAAGHTFYVTVNAGGKMSDTEARRTGSQIAREALRQITNPQQRGLA
jgi:tape measure domain-containing protein